eukprot:TRINITY_DN11477_c0_g1_i1.p2 TRINITY_DN11477_c0_g1~~TRINITY_DN11477_c0_g1_i1.p2  ORF type:complete len:251 (-),score=125.05 TRINITY_DN11477_c0_g1_i1:84-782(-)
MSLKSVSPAIENHVKGIWEKNLERDIPEEIVMVEQYVPSKDLVNEFEARRNELDRTIGGQKLQTIQAFVAVNKISLISTLRRGFYKTFGVNKLAFSTDPATAIQEASGADGNKIILCRITLGREGSDYQVVRNKYVISNLQGILPAFLITYCHQGKAISLAPTDLGDEPAGSHSTHQQAYQGPADDEIVFQEARVVRYDAPEESDGTTNVFGESGHMLRSEEDRLLKHVAKK